MKEARHSGLPRAEMFKNKTLRIAWQSLTLTQLSTRYLFTYTQILCTFIWLINYLRNIVISFNKQKRREEKKPARIASWKFCLIRKIFAHFLAKDERGRARDEPTIWPRLGHQRWEPGLPFFPEKCQSLGPKNQNYISGTLPKMVNF